MLNKFHSPMCPALAWLFCLVAPTGASATSTSKTMAATQTHVAQETNLTRAKRLLVVDPPFELKSEAREIGQFEYARVQKPLETKQFHELEAYAALLREKKPTFSSGRSLLYYFYDKIATRDSGYSLVRKQHMNGRTRVLYYKELVAEWQRQMPESLTARFVEGLLEHEMAWVVRRSRPASNMSGEEYSTFEDQEAKAEKIFLELDTKGFADPHLYTALLYVGRSLDRSPDILNGYLKKGIAIDPTYESIYIAMANVLLPRWGGSEKELHDFAVWASDSTKKALGDIIYVRLAYVARLTSGDRLKTRYNFSWERINRGFLDLHERFPLSNPIWQQHAWFTCHYEDREMAKLLLPHLRFYTNEVEKTFWRPTMEAWGSEEEFQRCKAWLGSQTSEKSSD